MILLLQCFFNFFLLQNAKADSCGLHCWFTRNDLLTILDAFSCNNSIVNIIINMYSTTSNESLNVCFCIAVDAEDAIVYRVSLVNFFSWMWNVLDFIAL